MNLREPVRSTTVLAVVRDGTIAMASDGQVTVGEAVMKQTAQKTRKAAKHDVLIGFAGGAADALALTERLESKLDEYSGNVRRAAVELAKSWRTDRALRRLEALLLIGNSECVWSLRAMGMSSSPTTGSWRWVRGAISRWRQRARSRITPSSAAQKSPKRRFGTRRESVSIPTTTSTW